MPFLSIWFIRASLVHLFIGFTFGGLLLANKGVQISPMIWALLPAHIEFTFIGWLGQFAMGVAFWILPRYGSGPPRGQVIWSWLAFILVNTGILLAVSNTWLGLDWLRLAGRILQVLGFTAFVTGNWGRVKPLVT